METNEIKDIEFLLDRCISQIGMYRNRAIESTIIHDVEGKEHEPTKQLFKNIKRCENAVASIKNELNIEVK